MNPEAIRSRLDFSLGQAKHLAWALVLLASALAFPGYAMAQDFIRTGTYTGDGTAGQAITGLGFQPDLVIVKASTNKRAFIRTADMAAGLSKKIDDNKALETNYIQTLDADGFTVGNKSDVNSSGVVYHWVAMVGSAAKIAVGQYVGDGTNNRAVPVAGMLPGAVMVIPARSEFPVYRTTDMPYWNAYRFNGGATETTSIGWFNSGVFYVGNSNTVNKAGDDYFYVAWGSAAGEIETGNYFGTGVAGNDISGLGLNPAYLLIANDGAEVPVHRPATLAGDATLFFSPQAMESNLIQSMWDGGFSLGSNVSVNQFGTNYYWLALANPITQADLQVAAGVDDPYPAEGQTVNLSVEVTNLGFAGTTGVLVSDPLPAGLTFQSAVPSQGTYDETAGIWDVGALADAQVVTLAIAAAVDAGTGGTTLTNTASVTASDLPDLDPANDTASQALTVSAALGADLQASIQVDDPNPTEGQTLNYLVTVSNIGPDNATGVVATTSLPATLTINGSTPSQGTFDSGLQTWDLGSLNAGQSHTLALVASVNNNTAGQTISSGAVIASLDQTDPNAANDSGTVDVLVQSADLQISKLVDSSTPYEGATVNYTVIVTNLGPDDAAAIQVSDLLPAGLTFQSASPSLGVYDEVAGLWTLGDIPFNGTEAMTISALVDAGTNGSTITNTAAITGSAQVDPNGANDSAAVDLTVTGASDVDLGLSVALDNTAPDVGGTILYTVTVTNPGPVTVTGLDVTSLLPAEVAYYSSLTNKGTYDEVSGLWSVGSLDPGYQAVLDIQGTVNSSAVGGAVAHSAAITAVDQPDPNPANNSSSVNFTVPVADLQMSMALDNLSPSVGDTLGFSVRVYNAGPALASGISVADLLPEGLDLISAAPGQGSYVALTGLWNVGTLNPGFDATLEIAAAVLTAAAGTTVTSTASVAGADQADSAGGNNSISTDVYVAGADLALTLVPDTFSPGESQPVQLTVTLTSAGPDTVSGVQVSHSLPAGLTFVSAAADQGIYDDQSGSWDVGAVDPGATVALVIEASVDGGTAGSTIEATAAISAATPADPNPADNSASASITIPTVSPDPENLLWPLVGQSETVPPGLAGSRNVLTFAFVNRGAAVDTLHSLVLTNLTDGSGTAAQMDAEWQTVVAGSRLGSTANESATASFSGGRAAFDALEWAIPAGDTLSVTISGAPSLTVRDGAVLRAGIAEAGDLVLNNPWSLISNWPLVSGQSLNVDGFIAAQAHIVPRESGLLAIGSRRNLALEVDLPGNGYLEDALYGLSLINNGTALPGSDISKLELWADDGDGVFDQGTDLLLGPANFSGDRWFLSGLNQTIASSGRRFYATVDIAETAQPARDIRLSLPAGNDHAVEMYSGNDGPVDVALENPFTLGISVTDRIILTGEWYLAGVALPGADDHPLLQFLATNTYGTDQSLQSLTVTNTSVADGATQAQLDALCQQVDLRLDANGNGELDDPSIDRRLGTGSFSGGKVTFSGLDLNLPADSGTRLFVTADLGLMTVADGNRLSGVVESMVDMDIPGTTIVSAWPLHSGVEWTVNGMTAGQISTGDISVLTLGPGEGPVLAMDLTVPANGYAEDELTGITFANQGTATAASVAAAELWEDGGDGAFDAGAGDDTSLGLLTLNGPSWSSTVLSRPIPASGLRLFASLTVAASPTDSVTVNLGLPTGGITVSSGNDGPLDEPVPGSGTLVISTSPLRTAVDFAAAATDTGQTGTIVMTVRNAGSEAVTDIVPELGFVTGAGLITLGGPQPATLTALDPGQEDTITWTFTSVLPGEAVLEGNVSGFISGGQARRSITTPTSAHRVFVPVPHLEVYPTANLPFSITRGQQGLVPLSLTLVNPGGADVANAHLTSISLSFQEGAEGPGVVPADLLEQVVISEGTNVYLATSSLPASGDRVDLVFNSPVVVTGSEPVTLGIRLDLLLDSTVPSFMVSINEPGWLVGTDAVNGASLAIVPGEGVFPIGTGQAVLVSPAAGLNLALPAQDSQATVAGQADVQLLELELSQSLSNDNSSTIDVGRLVFKFHGSDGLPLADPSLWFSRLSLRSSFQEHFSGAPVVEADSLIVMSLLAPITITGNATLPLRLYADMAADSPLGTVTTLVGSLELFDARDGNMNNPVPVSLTTDPTGPELTVLGPAGSLAAAAEGVLPAQVAYGAHDLSAIRLTLSNPGDAGTAAVACDSLQLQFHDRDRLPLELDLYFDRVHISREGEVLGLAIDPAAADGKLTLPLSGCRLEPAETLVLELVLDLHPDCPGGGIEAVIQEGAIGARDAITMAPVAVTAEAPGAFPFSSGLATLVEAADELNVAAESLMPPLLAPQPDAYQAMSLDLTNPAAQGSGGVQVNAITLAQDAARSGNPALGAMVQTVFLMEGETPLAVLDAIDAAATAVTLVPDDPLVIAADQTRSLTVEIVLNSAAQAGSLILVLEEGGIAAAAPGGGGPSVRVLPASGQVFPFATRTGTIGPASLAESYANFPNPFAAGREATTFAFSLPGDATVNLRVLTPHGEVVAVLLKDEPRGAGFHQSDTWSGLNGNGIAVRNGVYLAEMVAEFSDGTRQRVLRKVAVVR